MGNHLHLRPLKKVDSDYSIQASSPEESDRVQVCLLVVRGHVFSNINGTDLLLCTLAR